MLFVLWLYQGKQKLPIHFGANLLSFGYYEKFRLQKTTYAVTVANRSVSLQYERKR
ncbi:hypothetical protein PGB90_002940 [Kerria lacca]